MPYCARWGPSPPPFLAHVYCGQTAGWIKMLLGRGIDLGPSDAVLDWELGPSFPLKGAQATIFGPCLLWPRSPISTTAELL